MKAVLLNNFKLFKTHIIVLLLTVLFAIIVNFYSLIGSISSKIIVYTCIVTLILRTQIIFSDKTDDINKFLVMPVSINDYVKADITKNLIIFIISTVIFKFSLLPINQSLSDLKDFYFLNFITVDFLLLCFFHILYVKFKRNLIGILYYIALILIEFALVFYNLLGQISISALIYIIIILLSLYLDYKFSTKILKEMKE